MGACADPQNSSWSLRVQEPPCAVIAALGGARGAFGPGLARRCPGWIVVIRMDQAGPDTLDQLAYFVLARMIALHQETYDGVFKNFIQRGFGVRRFPMIAHDQDLA